MKMLSQEGPHIHKLGAQMHHLMQGQLRKSAQFSQAAADLRQQDIGQDFEPHAGQRSGPAPQRPSGHLQHALLPFPELFDPVMQMVRRCCKPDSKTG